MNPNHKEAVVLLNMGGPNNLFEVELFLKNMFSDPLILNIKNPILRKLVGMMIVASRKKHAISNYKQIGNKSPLVEITSRLVQNLQKLDSSRFYTYAMRYTPPFSKNCIQELKEKKISKVVLFTMYPQYSNTTTLSSIRDFLKNAKELNYNPVITAIENYPEDSGFIESCVEEIKNTKKDFSEFVLFLSAHSIPKNMVDNGDPYQREINACALKIKEALQKENIFFKKILVTYQSKLGPMQWLEPDTKAMIKTYRDEKIMIYPIAFTIDNSETHYELSIENKELAKELGVKEYVVCSCPNDSNTFAKAIINLINTKQKDIYEIKK